MIKFNREKVEITKYPDGTFSHNLAEHLDLESDKNRFELYYDNEEEVLALIYLAMHIIDIKNVKPDLFIPYLPNARMDRRKQNNELFTLKYMATLFNTVFEEIQVLDVHSDASKELLNNLVNLQPKDYIDLVLEDMSEHVVLYFPDKGAYNRYSNLFDGYETAYGEKVRDWKTGKIISTKVISNIDLKDRDILIIDDICSAGGTFYYNALALKDEGVKDIFLYVSHCENTIHKGELLKETSPIKRIYTTNSLKREHSDRIKVYDVGRDDNKSNIKASWN